MSDQLDLIIGQLQEEVEQFTADLARDDSESNKITEKNTDLDIEYFQEELSKISLSLKLKRSPTNQSTISTTNKSSATAETTLPPQRQSLNHNNNSVSFSKYNYRIPSAIKNNNPNYNSNYNPNNNTNNNPNYNSNYNPNNNTNNNPNHSPNNNPNYNPNNNPNNYNNSVDNLSYERMEKMRSAHTGIVKTIKSSKSTSNLRSSKSTSNLNLIRTKLRSPNAFSPTSSNNSPSTPFTTGSLLYQESPKTKHRIPTSHGYGKDRRNVDRSQVNNIKSREKSIKQKGDTNKDTANTPITKSGRMRGERNKDVIDSDDDRPLALSSSPPPEIHRENSYSNRHRDIERVPREKELENERIGRGRGSLKYQESDDTPELVPERKSSRRVRDKKIPEENRPSREKAREDRKLKERNNPDDNKSKDKNIMEDNKSKERIPPEEKSSKESSEEKIIKERDKEYEKLIMEKENNNVSRENEEERGRGRSQNVSRENEEERGRGRSQNAKERDHSRGRSKSLTRGKSRTREREHEDKTKSNKEFELLMGNTTLVRRETTKQPEPPISEVMTITDADAWTLFEIIPDLALERPLRDWELVSKVIGTWELDKKNTLLLKKFAYRNTLTLKNFNDIVPAMYGVLHLLETKKNKWQKRWFHIKDGSLYHSKDLKGKDDTLLCSLANFDIYTVTKPIKKCPTKFQFAVKSQNKVTMFVNENDYVRFLSAESLDKMNEWVSCIRIAKNLIMRQERPELFIGIPEKNDKPVTINLNAPLTNVLPVAVSDTSSLLTEITFELAALSTSEGPGIDKTQESGHAHSKSLGLGFGDSFGDLVLPSSPLPNNNNKESSGPFKGGSLLDKSPPIKPIEVETEIFAKGSLLASNEVLFEQAKEREKIRRAMNGFGIIKDPNSATLVQIDNSELFHKGSLLNKNREIIENNNLQTQGHLIQMDEGVRFHKGSLLAKSNESLDYEGNDKRLNKKSPGGPLLSIDTPPIINNSRNTSPRLLSPVAGNGRTLVDINMKTDAQHTMELRNANYQPLLSFLPSERTENENDN
ncbi:9510_t:CDS:10 [Diversispora eburnea]|uniref:9510_t:CDS:1 n=2 Tax=Diversisporales TaxID=214509 RepID=A0A9N8VTF4_9GLOM|nr:9510_t:CDS:10 [Diversispora eburnea]